MRTEQWARIKELFGAALPLTADARHKYLTDVCGGDETLREQVSKLLASHDRAQSFLEKSPELSLGSLSVTLEGRRVGPYEISSRIGAGGMGEIYKGRDARLDRIVALKVLPSHIATDAVARDRFEREARAVAALNHPHICTIHDIGHQDGVDFIVMEHLEGETLASRLERGALPLTQALNYAAHVASALDAVHGAGIVHRDLKPSNIMLTKVGAKLLDFGLSRADASGPAAPPPLSVPVSRALTAAGAIMGTIQYMAPERLSGHVADARSDLFSFGAVLYEMVAGKRAFDGESVPSLIEAIREQEPPPVPGLPPRVDRIIRACLAKQTGDRWQTARDLLRELEWIRGDDANVGDAAPATAARNARMVAWSSAVVGLAATAAIAAFAYSRFERAEPAPSPVRFEVSTPSTSDPMSFALSHDARQLAFVAHAGGEQRLWVRALDQLTARPLEGTDGASYPFWSPDGSGIGFFAEGKLKRVDTGGGQPVVLAEAPTGRGGTWNGDDTIVFAPTTSSRLMRVSAGGGALTAVTALGDGQGSHRWPQFLPDGRHFLFLSTQGQLTAQGTFVGSLDGEPERRVLDDDSPAMYATGHLLLVRRGALVVLPFDASRLVTAGEAAILAQPIGFDTSLSRAAFSVSETGVLAHRPLIAERRQLVWMDRTGATDGPFGAPDDLAAAAPDLPRGGGTGAVVRTVNGNADIWLIQAGGVLSRFTFHEAADVFAVLSPDGDRVVFASNRNGGYDLFSKTVQSRSDEQLLLDTQETKVPNDISPDGGYLLFSVQGPTTGVDIWGMPLEGDQAPSPVVQTPFDEMAAQFSPDGRWIAYQSNASGRMEVYVQSFPSPTGGALQVSASGGSQVRWRSDGNELFYVSPDGRMMAVPIREGGRTDALDVGVATSLFLPGLAQGANVPGAVGSRPQYAVAPDGRFLLNVSVGAETGPPIIVIVNWPAALRR